MNKTVRKEERYYIEKSKIEDFIKGTSSIAYPKFFSNNNYNQTLYFNNSEHEVPFEVSIKARRYSSSPWSKHFELELSDRWIFEIKKDLVIKNSRLRQKEREKLKLEEILKNLQNKNKIENVPITEPLQPYIANNYKRRHYIVKKGGKFRITVDDELKYYFFEPRFIGTQIGLEDYFRIEIKVPQDKLNSSKFLKIKKLLQELEAEPIISKKDMAYNLLSKYLKRKYNRYVESSNIEIEAKLSLSGKYQYIFHKIKKDFYNGLIKGFKIIEDFPYTLERGKLHRYIITPDNNYLRISINGKSKRAIIKENPEVINDPFGLDCIIKRKEIKKPLSSDIFTSTSKTLYRKRKYFLVENKKSGNSYCILIDRCTCEDNELFQMEIEGLLSLYSPSMNEEKEIIKDITYITNQLIKKYNVLKPTTLNKLDWLKTL